MGAETGEGEASGAGFESGAETGCILDEGVGLLGDEVWAGWEYMGRDGSVGLLGDEASEVMEAVLGRV